MVGEPYHGGDFMTLTQRAKDQRVQMTEEMLGGTAVIRKETPEKVELILFVAKKEKLQANIDKHWYV